MGFGGPVGTWWRFPAVAATLIAALASGCSASPQPARTLPKVQHSVAQAAATQPQETVASMEAFVRQYYAEIGRAALSGNVAPLEAMISRGCSCNRLVTFIAHSAQRGRITGFRYTLQKLYDAAIEGGAGTVAVVYSLPRAVLVGPGGSILAAEPPETNQTVIISTTWKRVRWVIANVVSAPTGG